MPAQTIGACCGDARFAATAAELADPGDDWVTWAAEVTPDPAASDAYQRYYQMYRDLYPATKAQAHALTSEVRRAAGITGR